VIAPIEVSFFAVNPDDESPGFFCPITYHSSLDGMHQVNVTVGSFSRWLPAGNTTAALTVKITADELACDIAQIRVRYWKK